MKVLILGDLHAGESDGNVLMCNQQLSYLIAAWKCCGDLVASRAQFEAQHIFIVKKYPLDSDVSGMTCI